MDNGSEELHSAALVAVVNTKSVGVASAREVIRPTLLVDKRDQLPNRAKTRPVDARCAQWGCVITFQLCVRCSVVMGDAVPGSNEQDARECLCATAQSVNIA